MGGARGGGKPIAVRPAVGPVERRLSEGRFATSAAADRWEGFERRNVAEGPRGGPVVGAGEAEGVKFAVVHGRGSLGATAEFDFVGAFEECLAGGAGGEGDGATSAGWAAGPPGPLHVDGFVLVTRGKKC